MVEALELGPTFLKIPKEWSRLHTTSAKTTNIESNHIIGYGAEQKVSI